MKAKKLVKKLHDLLDADKRRREKHRDELKALLQKMKAKEKALEQKLQDEKNLEAQKDLKQKISVLHAQRKKGLKTLKKPSNT